MSDWLAPVSKACQKITGKVFPFLLRWYYTEARLLAFLSVDISASGQTVNYYFSSQEGHCWVVISNFSPFDFTVDRLQATVSIDGGSFVCTIPVPEIVKAGTKKNIFAKGKSPIPEIAAPLAKQCKRAHVAVEAYVTSRIRSFNLRTHISEVRNLEIL